MHIFSLQDILKFLVVRVTRSQLELIWNTNTDKPWLGVLLNAASKEIRELEAELMLRPAMEDRLVIQNDRKAGNALSEKNFYHLTGELKSALRPADYLFLKALFAEGEEESVFLLQQAQMLDPRNSNIHLLLILLAAATGSEPEDCCTHLNDLMRYTPNTKDARIAAWVLTFVVQTNGNSPVNPSGLARLFNRIPSYPRLKNSLLHYAMEKLDAPLMKKLLDHIGPCDDNWIFSMVNAIVCTDTRDYQGALRWFSKLNREDFLPNMDTRLTLLYKYCEVLSHTGNRGRAILLLREIVFSGDFDGCLSDPYYYAILDLAEYAVRTRNLGEIRPLLAKMGPVAEYMESEFPGRMNFIMAEACMHADEWEQALVHYKKAYKVTRSSALREKIRRLETVREGKHAKRAKQNSRHKTK